jgi:hypothetical protein
MPQAPPEMETMPTRGGSIGPTFSRKLAVRMSSSIEAVRVTPYRRHMASNTLSSPTSEPVCAWATAPDTGLRPSLRMTMGFAAPRARAAAAAKRTGSLMDST